MIAFGPVPSRRLGRSLGINNIPPKVCSYSCVYCQLGNTLTMQSKRAAHYEPSLLVKDVGEKVANAKARGEPIDYLAFVPDGEPTLDAHLGEEIDRLRQFGIKIAVISNASLIGQPEVQEDLAKADWVSLKVDAVSEAVWRKIDRPHKDLDLQDILAGMRSFSKGFEGTLATETMLVRDVNDSVEHLHAVAEQIEAMHPATAYLSIATRPPAEAWVQSPDEMTIHAAYQTFQEHMAHVEHLIGYEGDAFAFTGNVREDLLSITSVHPMRKEAVDAFLKRAGEEWSVVQGLIDQGLVVVLQHEGHTYYMRKLHP